ncbi:MAG TPA: hypothetical protein VN512_09145 [Clostridia bacterium]|nr:hypothetical protein [Clostridia bacterium]
MKGFCKILSAACVIMLLASACAVPAGVSQPSSANEHELAEIRQSYRNAELVVRGVCVQTHADKSGAICADVEISEVIAGGAKAGSTVHCVSGGLKEGGAYLLFLGLNEDVHYAEDEASYSVIDADAVDTDGSSVILKDTGMTLTEVRKELKKLDAVISAPATGYYYTALAEMAAAADEIFIGKVEDEPAFTDTSFRSQEGGGTVEQQLPADIVRVLAYGAVKGALKYGDAVDLVYAPAMSADVVDAATLTAITYAENAVPKLKEGGVYLFFLVHGPDPKQSYFFPINPFQGYVRVENDDLSVSFVNKAILPYTTLTPLVQDIRAVLGI